MILTACGGGGSGGSDSDTDSGAASVTLSGTFVDAPVAGLNYRTETQHGVTDTHGRFHYKEGESVSFSLGGVTLGDSRAAETVTPSDLTGYGITSDDTKTHNMLRLLQTLDEDCDPSNGIAISDSMRARLAGIEMEIPDTALGFEQSEALRALLDESACAGEWVTALQADTHYRLSMQQEFADELAEIALIVLDGQTEPVAAVDAQGNSITLLGGDVTTGASGRIVLTGSDGEQIGVSLDTDGMPSILYLGNGTIIRLKNFSRESVDIHISGPDGSLLASHNIELTDELRGYFDYFNDISWIEGEAMLVQAPVSEQHTGLALLDALITPAYAEDLTQTLSLKMKRAAGVVKYATGVVKEAVKIDAVLKGNESAVGYIGDYVKDAAGKIKKDVKKGLKDILWNAAINELGLNQDEQRVLDVSIAAIQCGAAANLAGCKDAFVESVAATYELGGLLYEHYQDADRLALIESQLEMVDFDSRPPAVDLDTAIDGSRFSVGAGVDLHGEAYDPDEGFIPNERLFWKSNLDGALGTGERLTVTSLSPGVHVITLTAEAIDGERRSARLSVEIGNTAPEVTISSPASGGNYAEGDYITFNGTAEDAEEGTLSGTQLEWRSSFDNRLLGTGAVLMVNDLEAPDMGTYSAAYTHIITLTATDSYGASTSKSVEVSIHNILLQPPTVTIATTKTKYELGAVAYIEATAQDGTGAALAGNSVAWTSSLDGELGYGDSLDVSTLSEGQHEITVRVTDQGMTANDTLTVDVAPRVELYELSVTPTWSVRLPTQAALADEIRFVGFKDSSLSSLTATATTTSAGLYNWWLHYEPIGGDEIPTEGESLTVPLPQYYGTRFRLEVLDTNVYSDYFLRVGHIQANSEFVIPIDLTVPSKGVDCYINQYDGIEYCYWGSWQGEVSYTKEMTTHSSGVTGFEERWYSRGSGSDPIYARDTLFYRFSFTNGKTYLIRDYRTKFDADAYLLPDELQGRTLSVGVECSETGKLQYISGFDSASVPDGQDVACPF